MSYALDTFRDNTIADDIDYCCNVLGVICPDPSEDDKSCMPSYGHNDSFKNGRLLWQISWLLKTHGHKWPKDLACPLGTAEYKAVGNVIYNNFLLNKDQKIDLTNIDIIERYFKNLFATFFETWKTSSDKLWQETLGVSGPSKFFMHATTYRCLQQSLQGFLAHARYVLNLPNGPRYISALTCNQSILEAYFSQLRSFGNVTMNSFESSAASITCAKGASNLLRETNSNCYIKEHIGDDLIMGGTGPFFLDTVSQQKMKDSGQRLEGWLALVKHPHSFHNSAIENDTNDISIIVDHIGSSTVADVTNPEENGRLEDNSTSLHDHELADASGNNADYMMDGDSADDDDEERITGFVELLAHTMVTHTRSTSDIKDYEEDGMQKSCDITPSPGLDNAEEQNYDDDMMDVDDDDGYAGFMDIVENIDESNDQDDEMNIQHEDEDEARDDLANLATAAENMSTVTRDDQLRKESYKKELSAKISEDLCSRDYVALYQYVLNNPKIKEFTVVTLTAGSYSSIKSVHNLYQKDVEMLENIFCSIRDNIVDICGTYLALHSKNQNYLQKEITVFQIESSDSYKDHWNSSLNYTIVQSIVELVRTNLIAIGVAKLRVPHKLLELSKDEEIDEAIKIVGWAISNVWKKCLKKSRDQKINHELLNVLEPLTTKLTNVEYEVPVSISVVDQGWLSYPHERLMAWARLSLKRIRENLRLEGDGTDAISNTFNVLTSGRYHNQLYLTFESAIKSIHAGSNSIKIDKSIIALIHSKLILKILHARVAAIVNAYRDKHFSRFANKLAGKKDSKLPFRIQLCSNNGAIANGRNSAAGIKASEKRKLDESATQTSKRKSTGSHEPDVVEDLRKLIDDSKTTVEYF